MACPGGKGKYLSEMSVRISRFPKLIGQFTRIPKSSKLLQIHVHLKIMIHHQTNAIVELLIKILEPLLYNHKNLALKSKDVIHSHVEHL